jgi:transcriptional regulator with XRE-family HTH domain
MYCDLCVRGFHTYCVGVKEVLSATWLCLECKSSNEEVINQNLRTQQETPDDMIIDIMGKNEASRENENNLNKITKKIEDIDKDKIIAAIKEKMEKNKITQSKLALKLGSTQKEISRFLNNKGGWTRRSLIYKKLTEWVKIGSNDPIKLQESADYMIIDDFRNIEDDENKPTTSKSVSERKKGELKEIEDKDKDKIIAAIKEKMIKSKITQTKLALELGVSQGDISRFLNKQLGWIMRANIFEKLTKWIETGLTEKTEIEENESYFEKFIRCRNIGELIEETIGPFIVTRINKSQLPRPSESTSIDKIEILEIASQTKYSYCFINTNLLKNIEEGCEILILKYMFVKLTEKSPYFIRIVDIRVN